MTSEGAVAFAGTCLTRAAVVELVGVGACLTRAAVVELVGGAYFT